MASFPSGSKHDHCACTRRGARQDSTVLSSLLIGSPTRKLITRAFWAIVLLAAIDHACAQPTPVGLWKTIDDNDNTARSLVRISESGGVYIGKLEKILDTDAKPDETCDKCTDERKGKRLLGMTLIRNIRQNPDDKEIFDGGDIVDPDDGKVYRLRLKPEDGGKRLQVRGYIGPFFRNQYWIRVE
jgi:uncharacterized protein (DUF2147 family)